jgi:hypothetical protein
MTWTASHKSAEELASTAHEALRSGRADDARALFVRAAQAEEQALHQVDVAQKARTYGITAVSAVALWYKAQELSLAEQLAHRILANPAIPAFAADQLRELLQAVWNDAAQRAAAVSFIPGQVMVSVQGGEVVRGGAPLDLVVDKVQTIQALFYRTAEFLKQLPLRQKGPAPRDIQELCRPWLFQSVPGSYQFAVAIQGPKQGDLFEEPKPDPKLVATTFLSILESAAGDPLGALPTIVPDRDYRGTFLKLTRNLAPSGRVFTRMEIRASQDQTPILLTPESRKVISQTIRAEGPQEPTPPTSTEQVLRGTLRAVHLDKDWLELIVDNQTVHVSGVGETVDDVIGPMVNHQVTVHATRDQKGVVRFKDIELEE